MARPKQFKESDILEKAVELFWKQGYHATSIQDLVDHLGVNRASLYGAFGDKQGLFEQALKNYQETNVAIMKDFLDQYDSVKEAFVALFQRGIEKAHKEEFTRGCFVINTTAALLPEEKELLENLSTHKELVENIFQSYLKKGMDQGEFSPSLHLPTAASLLFTLYSGLNLVSKLDQNTEQMMQGVKASLAFLNPA
ncbi:MAG: TetR/AcrR family transcriptional regulator [Bacteroidota bacterium]